MMRILVDGRALAGASAYRGIGTYLRNVVSGLAEEPGVELRVLSTAEAMLPTGAVGCRVHRRAPGRFQALEHDLLLPLDLRRFSADVVHSPATDPPRHCGKPWVQTLHDLIPLTHPGNPKDAQRWRHRAPRLQHAAAVITVSRWVADTAVSLLGLQPDRVHVAPLGVSPSFRPPVESGSAAAPFVLFVGEYDGRKRHHLAFEAIGALADRGFPHHLKVVGRVAPWWEATITSLVRSAPLPERIELCGYVDEPALIELYQQADALVVTSSAEGFGLPALEAMACGTPVVAFDNSATSEVVGPAGVLVADGDVRALVEALAALLADEGRRRELSAQAVLRASGFTWEECVQRHREVFAQVLA